MKTEKDLLPGCELYRKYLNIASIRLGLRMEEVRKKFGLFTINQWEEMLSNAPGPELCDATGDTQRSEP